MKSIFVAALAVAALSLPAAAADSDHHPATKHQASHSDHHPAPAMGDDHRNPNAWQDRTPNAVVGHMHWSRGDRLYHDYMTPDYYVTDWKTRHLRRPPHGDRWVHVNDNYLLVAIATGVILDVAANQ
jgi:Ni/Co efflux regulator RcnB